MTEDFEIEDMQHNIDDLICELYYEINTIPGNMTKESKCKAITALDYLIKASLLLDNFELNSGNYNAN